MQWMLGMGMTMMVTDSGWNFLKEEVELFEVVGQVEGDLLQGGVNIELW